MSAYAPVLQMNGVRRSQSGHHGETYLLIELGHLGFGFTATITCRGCVLPRAKGWSVVEGPLGAGHCFRHCGGCPVWHCMMTSHKLFAAQVWILSLVKHPDIQHGAEKDQSKSTQYGMRRQIRSRALSVWCIRRSTYSRLKDMWVYNAQKVNYLVGGSGNGSQKLCQHCFCSV